MYIALSRLYKRSLMVLRLPFLITCSDDSKPCMILKALDQSYKNHIGFAIIRAILRCVRNSTVK